MSSAPSILCPLGEGQEPQNPGDGRTFTTTQDCYVMESVPTSTAGCGMFRLDIDPGPDGQRRRTLVKFPLDQIPSDAYLEKALLKLYYWDYGNNDPAGNTVYVKEVDDHDWEDGDTSWRYWDTSALEPWDVKWSPLPWRCHHRSVDEYPELTPGGKVSKDTIPSSYGWMSFGDNAIGIGMTESARGIFEGDRTNYGWELNGESDDDPLSIVSFYSSRYSDSDYRPKLNVHYVVPPELDDVLYISNLTYTDKNHGSVDFHASLADPGTEYATLARYNSGVMMYFHWQRLGSGVSHYPWYIGY